MCFTAVCHPLSNEVIEHANGNILTVLNQCLIGLAKGLWVEELPKVLWSLRITLTWPTGFTPFCLLFGYEAMTPEEACINSLRVLSTDTSDEEVSKDLVEETCLVATTSLAKY